MIKKILCISAFSCFSFNVTISSLQVAIPTQDFCAGNWLVLITKDTNGLEQMSYSVALESGKTEFSYEELKKIDTIQSVPDLVESCSIQNSEENQQLCDLDTIIYLYFDINPSNIVRAIVIKNNLLEDNPYHIINFNNQFYQNNSQIKFSNDDDDNDDNFFNLNNMAGDDLSHFNLSDIQGLEPVQLSLYDTLILSFYAVWAVQSSKLKQAYKQYQSWIFNHNEQE